MKDEVEEFLRRVAQLRAQAEAQARAQQQRPGFQQPPPQQQAPPQRLAPSPPPQRLAPQEDVVYLEPAEPEVIDAEVAELGDDVGRHVNQYIRGDKEIAEHTRHLGEEVDQAENKLQTHLHQTFDHKLGQLRKTATDTAAVEHAKPAPEVTATDLRKMLRSPASIRDAIIMSEILRRPEDRW